MRKKHIIRKTFCVIFSLFLTFSCVGCKDDKNALEISKNETFNNTGFQDVSVSETNYDFIRDGKTDYQIVIAENASDMVKSAAQELAGFVYEASSITMPIVKDSGLSYDSEQKYISFGENNLSKTAQITVDYSVVGSNGYIVKTKGQSVFFLGGSDYGTSYATYEFLKHEFGYELYAADEIVLEKGVKNKKLLYFDITVRPTFEWRHIPFVKVDFDSTNKMRFRFHTPNEIFIRFNGGQWVHNALNIIPYNEENRTNHPEWFSSNVTTDPDLCYSNEGTLAEVIKVLKAHILAEPQKELVTISSPDGLEKWCRCEKCEANYDKYGADSATLIQFCNKVNKEIKRWIKEELKEDRRIQILFLAYNPTRKAPVKQQNGTYAPIDESVVCDEGVSVFLTTGCTGDDFLTDTETQSARELAAQWKIISPHQFNYWIYTENYFHFLPFADSFGSLSSVYQFAQSKNTFFMLNNGQGNTSESTGFCNLKTYLDYELMWNCDQNVNNLIDKFFAHYFKEANVPMRNLFNSLRTISKYQRDHQNTSLVNYDIVNSEFYPLPFLEKCMEYIEEAYKAIEPIKDKDAELYQKLHNRINIESISIRYLLIDIYGATFTDSQLLEMKLQFKKDAEKLDITHLAETVLITTLWNNWGI